MHYNYMIVDFNEQVLIFSVEVPKLYMAMYLQ